MSETPFDQWAIVEVFGHVRLAGHVTEAMIGGGAFIRVDVPEVAGQPAFTRFYGQGAIYSITLVTEEVARRAAEAVRERALTVYIPPVRHLAPSYGGGDPHDQGQDDDEPYDAERDGDD